MDFIARPFGVLMEFIYNNLAFHNYGLAIIVFTLFVKILFLPLSIKQQRSMERQQAIAPELEAIRNKFKGDNKRIQEEQMNLYSKYNISPMSGCIFALIQIPLFFAFYESMNRLPVVFEGTFLKIFNLGTSPLTAMQHGEWQYLILVVLVAAVTYFSFKLNKTASMNSEQAKSMG